MRILQGFSLTDRQIFADENLMCSTPLRLAKRTAVKFQTIDRYYKNRVVRYDSYILDRICVALECTLSDIIEYVEDDEAPRL